MQSTFIAISPGQVKLLPSIFQERFDLNIRFLPLYEVIEQRYTVYFQIRSAE